MFVLIEKSFEALSLDNFEFKADCKRHDSIDKKSGKESSHVTIN